MLGIELFRFLEHFVYIFKYKKIFRFICIQNSTICEYLYNYNIYIYIYQNMRKIFKRYVKYKQNI